MVTAEAFGDAETEALCIPVRQRSTPGPLM
jgi:hypothetical protein